ncbi:hypothetical protein BJ508DRAFT_335313 [Ascobolus immersus RN42]|uniref:Uncharacterized protein n=1 Tax=Ascobolus immersus RN42 TaxID=1160509 RepID=A0A3N4HGC3_ASCIM|nr:hypothetical protein BJ508DRAFT_335313 [Ascobolus immersus RN42]
MDSVDGWNARPTYQVHGISFSTPQLRPITGALQPKLCSSFDNHDLIVINLRTRASPYRKASRSSCSECCHRSSQRSILDAHFPEPNNSSTTVINDQSQLETPARYTFLFSPLATPYATQYTNCPATMTRKTSFLALLLAPLALAQCPHSPRETGLCSRLRHDNLASDSTLLNGSGGLIPHTDPDLAGELPDCDMVMANTAHHPSMFNRPIPCYFDGDFEAGLYHAGPKVHPQSVSSYVSPHPPPTEGPDADAYASSLSAFLERPLPTHSATGVPLFTVPPRSSTAPVATGGVSGNQEAQDYMDLENGSGTAAFPTDAPQLQSIYTDTPSEIESAEESNNGGADEAPLPAFDISQPPHIDSPLGPFSNTGGDNQVAQEFGDPNPSTNNVNVYNGAGVPNAAAAPYSYDTAVGGTASEINQPDESQNSQGLSPGTPTNADAFYSSHVAMSNSDPHGSRLDELNAKGINRIEVNMQEADAEGNAPEIAANVRLGEQGRANAAARGNFPANPLENPAVYDLRESVPVEEGAIAGEFSGAGEETLAGSAQAAQGASQGRAIMAGGAVRTLVARQEDPTPTQPDNNVVVGSLAAGSSTAENLIIATVPATSIGDGLVKATAPAEADAIVTSLPVLLADTVIEDRRPMELFHIMPSFDWDAEFHPIDLGELSDPETAVYPPDYGLMRATDVPEGVIEWVPIPDYNPHPRLDPHSPPEWPFPEYIPNNIDVDNSKPDWEYVDYETGRVMKDEVYTDTSDWSDSDDDYTVVRDTTQDTVTFNEPIVVSEAVPNSFVEVHEPIVISETQGAPIVDVRYDEQHTDVSDLVDRLHEHSVNTIRPVITPEIVEKGPEFVDNLTGDVNLEFQDVLRTVAQGEINNAAATLNGEMVEEPTLQVQDFVNWVGPHATEKIENLATPDIEEGWTKRITGHAVVATEEEVKGVVGERLGSVNVVEQGPEIPATIHEEYVQPVVHYLQSQEHAR